MTHDTPGARLHRPGRPLRRLRHPEPDVTGCRACTARSAATSRRRVDDAALQRRRLLRRDQREALRRRAARELLALGFDPEQVPDVRLAGAQLAIDAEAERRADPQRARPTPRTSASAAHDARRPHAGTLLADLALLATTREPRRPRRRPRRPRRSSSTRSSPAVEAAALPQAGRATARRARAARPGPAASAAAVTGCREALVAVRAGPAASRGRHRAARLVDRPQPVAGRPTRSSSRRPEATRGRLKLAVEMQAPTKPGSSRPRSCRARSRRSSCG